MWVAAEGIGDGNGHRNGVALPLQTCTRVGIARVDDDGARQTARDVAPRHNHGCGDRLVCGEDGGAGHGPLGSDEREITLAAGLQAGAHASREEAERGDDTAVGVGEIGDIGMCGHVRLRDGRGVERGV